jgi:hypothetical protein
MMQGALGLLVKHRQRCPAPARLRLQGSLPQGGLGGESGGCTAAASLEPTVTIGANEAYAAVNAMFKVCVCV